MPHSHDHPANVSMRIDLGVQVKEIHSLLAKELGVVDPAWLLAGDCKVRHAVRLCSYFNVLLAAGSEVDCHLFLPSCR